MKPFIYLSTLLILSNFIQGQNTPIAGNLEVSGSLYAGGGLFDAIRKNNTSGQSGVEVDYYDAN